MGVDLTSEYSPVEAGLARSGVKDADFIGKAAYLNGARGGTGGEAVHADDGPPHQRVRCVPLPDRG